MSALGVGVPAMPVFTAVCSTPDLLSKQWVTDGATLNADIAFTLRFPALGRWVFLASPERMDSPTA